MAKMLFTFKWGKSIYVTQDDLKRTLLKYYTKTEVDKILKQYVTIENLAGELVEYAKLDDLNILDNHLTDLIGNNTELINEVTDALKNAKLWNIVGMWDSTTTYKIGDVVGYTNNELYLSVIDNNTNNKPDTSTGKWIKVTNVQSFNLDDYYNKIQIDNKLKEYALKTDYYTKQETYSKEESNEKFVPIQSNIYNRKKYTWIDFSVNLKNLRYISLGGYSIFTVGADEVSVSSYLGTLHTYEDLCEALRSFGRYLMYKPTVFTTNYKNNAEGTGGTYIGTAGIDIPVVYVNDNNTITIMVENTNTSNFYLKYLNIKLFVMS